MKISEPIHYPIQLDMKNYQQPSDNISKKATIYTLIGLQEHIGRYIDQGHYTAHVLRDGVYYKADDHKIKKVT